MPLNDGDPDPIASTIMAILIDLSSLLVFGVSQNACFHLMIVRNSYIYIYQISSYIIYQTTFHPLANYPGPFFAKLSSLYSVRHAVKGSRHTDLYDLHLRHGVFVRYGPNHISINSASALEQIYGQKANVQKSSWCSSFYSVSIFNAIDKNVHARKRRVMSQAFSDQALRGMEPHILSTIRHWCNGLGKNEDQRTILPAGEWSTPKDMAHWAAYMVFDVLGEICFGESFGTSVENDNRFFLDLMTANVRVLNIIGQMPILKRLNLAAYMMRGTQENRKKQIAFSRQQLSKRLNSGLENSGRRDIIYYLQQARDPETGEGYSEMELMSETTLLLGAGKTS